MSIFHESLSLLREFQQRRRQKEARIALFHLWQMLSILQYQNTLKLSELDGDPCSGCPCWGRVDTELPSSISHAGIL